MDPIWPLVRRWWWIPLALIAATVIVSVLLPPTYRARATFVPDAGGGANQVAAIAAQLGLVVPASDPARSPQFYADLLRSPGTLRDLLLRRYDRDGPGPEPESTLVALLDPGGANAEERLERAVESLRRNLHLSVSLKTGVVTLTVDAATPWLARDIAAGALDAVQAFDVRTRQSQGRVEREFVESRLQLARDELRDSEDRMERFLRENREYRGAPRLAFEHERLQRDLALRREVHASLATAYEQARIAEVRGTPAITIVDAPVLAARQEDRHLLLRSGAAAMLGVLGIAGLGIWRRIGPSAR